MRFESPALLAWAWLIAVPVLLYLFRRRPKQVRVSTLPFFKALQQVYQESAWLRRLKRLLSFLLTAAVVAASVLALARVLVTPEADALESVIVVVDSSASMAAEDAEARSRLQVATAVIRERLAGLPSGVGVLVMRYDRRPEILLARTFDRRAVHRALDRIEVRPVAGDAGAALRLAARFAAIHGQGAIWHATDDPGRAPRQRPAVDPASVRAGSVTREEMAAAPDAGPPERTDRDELSLPPGVTLQTMDVSLQDARNVGITAFQLRALPLEHGRLEAFVEVHGAGPAALEAQLEVRTDGSLAAIRSLTIPPGGVERLVVPVEATHGQTLSVLISSEGDVLETDDVVHARIPAPRPTRALWVRETPDPFTQLALSALSEEGELEVYEVAPDGWPSEEPVDVVIFDGVLPKVWPERTAVLVMRPPGPLGPVRASPIAGAGLPVDRLRAVYERHPLLFGVASDRVAITQTAVLEADGALEPLWVGPMGPLLAAGEVKGQRVAVMAFTPEGSERLALTASYPLLLGNAILWLARPRASSEVAKNLRTGDVVEVAGDELRWSVPAGGGAFEDAGSSRPGRGRLLELDRVGLWETADGARGSASLLSREETLLSSGTAEGAEAAEVGAGFLSALARGDLRPLFLWCVLGLLLLESCLFHRWAVF